MQHFFPADGAVWEGPSVMLDMLIINNGFNQTYVVGSKINQLILKHPYVVIEFI